MPLVEHFRAVGRSYRDEMTPVFVISAICMCFANLLYGIDTGSFGAIQALKSFKNRFAPINAKGVHAWPTKTQSVMNGIVWPSKLFGVMCYEPLIARYGYRPTMYFLSILQCVALAVQLSAKTWQVFSGGRIIAYYAVGIAENAGAMYLAETSPAAVRAFMTGGLHFFVSGGNLWGAGMGKAVSHYETDAGWRIAVAVQFIPPVGIMTLMWFCPESPRWLILKNKRTQAIKALRRLRPKSLFDDETLELEANTLEAAVEEAAHLNQGGWLDLFRGNYLRRTWIVTSLFLFGQAAGNQLINLYGPTFFQQIGAGEMAFTYNTVIQALSVVSLAVSMALADVWGRRSALMAGLSTSMIFAAVIGGVGSKPKPSPGDLPTIVASMAFLGMGVRIGIGPLTWVIGTELGGPQLRKKLLAAGSAVDVFGAFLVSFTVPYLIKTPGANLGAKMGFIFMGVNFLALLYTIFFVPELRGRSLEEVDELFERKLWAWQFAKAETHGAGAMMAQIEQGKLENYAKNPGAAESAEGVDDVKAEAPVHIEEEKVRPGQ